MSSLTDRIERLKKEKNAVVLAHNYTSPEVQEVADYVGDSLGLSIAAVDTDADIIVFCGVSFMGETAKILNPEKTVLLPVPEAYCAMASMCSAEQLREYKKRNPDHLIVGYVNTTADAKAEMDVCCTSSNALKVVEFLGEKDILFVPDRNLGTYVMLKTGKKIRLWNGFCPIHHGITVSQVENLISEYPNAPVIAHPECRTEVLALAHHVGSTEAIVKIVQASDSKEFIILTEVGMIEKLEKTCPGKKFHFPSQAVCSTMKMIDLESILNVLETGCNEVLLDPIVAKRAEMPVKKMMDITQ